jgi:hypothetical protein
MQNPQNSSIFEHSLSVVELARPLVESIQRKDPDLGSQLRRIINGLLFECNHRVLDVMVLDDRHPRGVCRSGRANYREVLRLVHEDCFMRACS